MMAKETIGVGFLLFSKNGWEHPKFFTIKELQDKPQYHKYAGMKSFPLETYENKDGDFISTIKRLAIEEMGISPEKIEILGIDKKKFRLIPGRQDIYTVYGYGILKESPYEKFNPADDDIEFYGWESISSILKKKVRIEVPPMLKHFEENHFQKVLAKF